MASNLAPRETRAPAEDSAERRVVASIWRIGLAVSSLLMFAGLVGAAATDDLDAGPASVGQLLDGGNPGALCAALGIVLLALTPAVRVLALLWSWSRLRDWRFVFVSLAVVVTLSLAALVGRG